MLKKTYVNVTASFDTEGSIRPTSLRIHDKTFVVDKVLEIRHAAAMKIGGVGVRYLISISCDEENIFGKKCHLWLEKGIKPERWFVGEEASTNL